MGVEDMNRDGIFWCVLWEIFNGLDGVVMQRQRLGA